MADVLGKKTKILLEASTAVQAENAICCGCGCLHTKEDCVTVKFEGFASNNATCSECDCYGNSTYILRRGVGYTTDLPPADTPPTVTGSVRASRGSGAELGVSLSENDDGSYSISSVSVNKGGSGYDHTAEFAYQVQGSVGYLGDPVVKITTTPVDPTVTVTTPGTSVAKATLENTASKAVWGVTKIEVVSAGSGVSEGAAVSLETPTGYAAPHATAFCLETHGEATAVAQIYQGANPTYVGSGAEIVLSLSAVSKDEYGRDLYSVVSATVASNGDGYAPETTSASVTPTDGSAAIQGATLKLSFSFGKPDLRCLVFGSAGSGAVISLEAEQVGVDHFGRELWGVSGATVVAQGSGYTSDAFAQVAHAPDEWSSAVAAAFTLTRNQDGGITAVNVTNPGVYYATRGWISGVTITNPGLYRKRTGGLYGVIVTSAGAYYGSGEVTDAEVIDGGKFWNVSGDCLYLYKECAACPCYADPGDFCIQRIEMRFSPNMRRHTFTAIRHYTYYDDAGYVSYGQQVILSASTVNDGGDVLSSVTFEPEDFTTAECAEVGTVTVTPVGCESQSKLCCQMPKQITMSLSGMERLFVWSGGSGPFDSNSTFTCPEDSPAHPGYETFCGLCDTGVDAYLWQFHNRFNLVGYFGSLVVQDFSSVVLDLQPSDCGTWLYTGLAPTPPSESWVFPAPIPTVSCNGQLGVPVSVRISPVGLSTTVAIGAPIWGGSTATAEPTVEEEAVSAINVTYGGDGYAREVFERTEPAVAVTISSPTGSGAVLSATLTQVGEGENAYWRVSAVTVVSGGTGYIDGDSIVVFTPEEGATTQIEAQAFAYTGLIEPTLTASVSGGEGTGATLAVSMAAGYDQWGFAYWYVASVTVINGGSGYSEEDSVSFTVTDGVEVGGAWAALVIAREEPSVGATTVSEFGTGASLAATLASAVDEWTGRTYWYVSSIEIMDGGSGYAEFDSISFSTDGVESAAAEAVVSAVDGNGAIVAIALYSGGAYYKPTGVIEAVEVIGEGYYYKDSGVIESIVLFNEGAYYKEQSANTSEVHVPHVAVVSRTGFGASATATVDGELGSPTFGQVTSVTVDNGGERYFIGGTAFAIEARIEMPEAQFVHRQSLLFVPPETSFVGPSGLRPELNCLNFGDRMDLVRERVSTNSCPKELLSKSYPMFLEFGFGNGWWSQEYMGYLPPGFADFCWYPNPLYPYDSFGLRIFGFANDIVITLGYEEEPEEEEP